MLVTSLKWKFDADSIRGTPRTQGVFGLWDEDQVVYIGATARSVFLPDALRELPLYNQPASSLQLLRRDANPAPDLSLP